MKIFKQLLTISLFIILTSCSKDSDAPTPVPPDVTTNGVRIVGSEKLDNKLFVPVIWLDGVKSVLPFTANSSTLALKVAVDNNDVYVVGIEDITTKKIVMWKNGIKSTITTGANYLTINELVVDNGNVYILGEEDFSGDLTPKYKIWKNGVAQDIIPTIDSQGKANEVIKMIVANNDTYVVGYETRTNTNNSIAKFWKNGIATAVSSSSADSHAHSVVVSGADVNVLLTEENKTNFKTVVKIWKNGVKTTIGSGNTNFIGLDMTISNNNTHVVMREGESFSNSKLVYFKNNIKTDITTGTPDDQFVAMKVDGDNVCIAFINNYTRGKYWLNGIVTSLTGISTDEIQTLFLVNKTPYFLPVTNFLLPVFWKNEIKNELTTDPLSNFTSANDIFVTK